MFKTESILTDILVIGPGRLEKTVSGHELPEHGGVEGSVRIKPGLLKGAVTMSAA
jgi:hypothetical protein